MNNKTILSPLKSIFLLIAFCPLLFSQSPIPEDVQKILKNPWTSAGLNFLLKSAQIEDISKLLSADLNEIIGDSFFSELDRIGDTTPSFFKKHLPTEWHLMGVKSPIDSISRGKYRDRVTLSFQSDLNFNASIKVKALKEGAFHDAVPQVTIGFAGFVDPFSRIMSLVPSLSKMLTIDEIFSEAPFYGGYTPSISVAKSISPTAKVYGGYKYATGTLSFKFADTVSTIGGTKFEKTLSSSTLFLGMNMLYLQKSSSAKKEVIKNKLRETSFQVAYNLTDSQMYVKTESSSGIWTLGLGVYPFKSFSLLPYLRLSFTF